MLLQNVSTGPLTIVIKTWAWTVALHSAAVNTLPKRGTLVDALSCEEMPAVNIHLEPIIEVLPLDARPHYAQCAQGIEEGC